MYSPGNYHLRVPRDRVKNLKWRLYVLRRCREDTRFRAAVLEMCRTDIVFFVNTFVWQFNPNTIGTGSPIIGPFVTWGFQDRAVRTILDCVYDRTDLVIEKSREMGASWLCLIVMLWFWLFHPLSKFLCISRNADAVDDADDADSLFWKLDYIVRHLPDWMVPRYNRRVMAFSNQDNGSQITGQATTGKAGVGGRALAIFVDEYSQIKEDWEVYDRTSDTSGCRIFNGTHKGTTTAFYELTRKAETSRHLRKLVMHWTDHPDKRKGAYHWDRARQRVVYDDPYYEYPASFKPVTDGTPTGGPFPGVRSPWYDAACERKGSTRAVAADIDINPTGSIEQVFDALMIHDRKARYARDPDHHDIEYDRDTAEPKALVPDKTGLVSLWLRLEKDGTPPPGQYVFGADIAQGTGATPSCLSGVNASTGEKVFEYTNAHIEPKDFAYLAVAVCRLFKTADGQTARLIWEVPGPGQTFGKHVLALGYRNIYYRSSDTRVRKEVSDTPGWSNAPDPMLALILNYRDALRGSRFLNRSAPALVECLSFVYGPDGYVYHTGAKDAKDPSGGRINHGDRVVADALCWKLVDELGKLANPTGPDGPADDGTVRVNSLAWRVRLDKMKRAETSAWAD